MNIFCYWSGDKPKWIDTCLRSIQRHCTDGTKFYLLTPETIQNEVTAADEIAKDTLPKRWLDLPPGVGTDCLRATLLYHLGGLWMDADTICVANPGNLIKNRHSPEQFLYSRWPTKPDRVIAGYVYSPRNHPIARQWLNVVQSVLLDSEHIGWGDLGEKILTLLVNMSPSAKSSWQMPMETFLPVDIDSNVGRYFECSDWRGFATNNTITFGLNHSWMMHHQSGHMLSFPENLPSVQHRSMIQRLLADAETENIYHERRSARAK